MEGLIFIGIAIVVVMSLAGGMGATSITAGNGYGAGGYGSGSSNGYGGNGSGGSTSQSPYGGSGSQGSGGFTSDVGGSDADILARTAYGEARNQGQAGLQAVMSVVVNRYNAGFAGGSIAGICQQPYQFSCWNAGDPNLAVIQNVDSSNAIFQQCLQLANMAVTGSLPDNTGGATYYHDTSISTPRSWGAVVETTQIGRLIFFVPAGSV